MTEKPKRKFDAEDRAELSELLQKAIATEKLSKTKAASFLGISQPNMYRICSPDEKYRALCPDANWERIEEWWNSDLSIVDKRYPAVPSGRKSPEAKPPPGTVLLDDVIDKVYDGIILAMEYEIPKTKWKAFLKRFVLSNSKEE